MRDFALPGRSPAVGCEAMIATSHTMASAVGLEVLHNGGSAVDAALTAAAMLCVVEPQMTGIGGDSFALVAMPDGQVHAMSGTGRAPAGASRAAVLDALKQQGLETATDGYGAVKIPRHSALAVTVPGAIAGWAALHEKFGKLAWAALFAPAIAAARDGFPVAGRVAADWADTAPAIAGDGDAAAVLLSKDGRAPAPGTPWRFPALGETLARVAENGPSEFYKGETARDMVAKLQAVGGLHTLADFERQDANWMAPLERPLAPPYGAFADAGQLSLVQLPPHNQGLLAHMMMGILAHHPDYRAHGPLAAERYHIMLEAARLAYTARGAHLADPDHHDVPTETLLADATLRELAGRIDPAQRTPDLGPVPTPGGSNTIYLSVTDSDGMTVSFINSVYSSFGACIAAPGSGVVFNNRAQGFVLDEGHPNVIAGGKRPMHTLAPGMLLRDGKPALSFGVMGADFQPMGQVYVLSNMLHFGMDVQEALDAPRIFFEAPPAGVLGAETGVPRATIDGLRAMGHDVQVRAEPWGGGQAIHISSDRGAINSNSSDGASSNGAAGARGGAQRVLLGGSDPRKDGCAIGF